jgi:hypothetical protein
MEDEKHKAWAALLLKHHRRGNVLDYVEPDILQCAPLTASVDVDALELFRTVLEMRFGIKHQAQTVPVLDELFALQKELLEPMHDCLRQNGGQMCMRASIPQGEVYESVFLGQQMRSTGLVSVCCTSGAVHVCDGDCSGMLDEEFYVCPFSGKCKSVQMRASATSWGDGPADKERSTVIRRDKHPSKVVNISFKRDRTKFEEDVDSSNFAQTPTPAKALFTFTSDDDEQTRTLEQAVLRVRNIRRNLELDPHLQTFRAPAPLLSKNQQMLLQVQQKLSFRIANINAPAQPEAKGVSYAEFTQGDAELNLLYEHIAPVFRSLFIYYQQHAAPISETTAVSIAAKSMGQYIPFCSEHNMHPNFWWAYCIFLSTYRELLLPPNTNTIERNERYLAELILYYWQQLQGQFFNPPTALPSEWARHFRRFVSGFLYSMRRGMVIDRAHDHSVTIIPTHPYVLSYLHANNNTSCKDVNKRWVFPAEARIMSILHKNKHDPVFVEKLSYERARAHAEGCMSRLRWPVKGMKR